MQPSLLQKIPLFAALDPDDLARLSAFLKRETFPAHHTIFWMDEKGERLYVIESGHVAISYNDENGQEHVLNTLGPGAFFGELALIDGGTHTATARTAGETVVLTLDRDSFYQFLDKHPKFSHALLHALTNRLRTSTIRLRGVTNVNDELAAKNSSFQQSIDRMAKGFTSSTFLGICVFFITLWIAFQTFHYTVIHHYRISFTDRPPTFFLLGFIITLTSFLLTILILNSQRRQAEHDRIRGEVEYQVNLKSQTEVMRLQLKMDRLIDMVQQFTKQPFNEEDDESITV